MHYVGTNWACCPSDRALTHLGAHSRRCGQACSGKAVDEIVEVRILTKVYNRPATQHHRRPGKLLFSQVCRIKVRQLLRHS